jgi:hypothetical protein
MLKLSHLFKLSGILLLTSSLGSFAQTATDKPNFTGVWLAFASTRGEQAELTDYATSAIDNFLGQYGDNFVEPGSYCVPPGMPSTMTSIVGYPIEIVQTPDRIFMLAEIEMQVRRIFMDGRAHPENYPDSRMGHSIGHWDESSLVIDTGLLKENLSRRGARSENTQITERVSMTKRSDVTARQSGFIITPPVGDDVLVFDMTVTDPALFESPSQVTTYYQRIEDDAILEYDCAAELWQQALDAAL